MGRYKQANRPIAIHTPLGPDALLLEKFSGIEAISRLYRFQLDLLAEQPIDFNRLLGQAATVLVNLPNRAERRIHGMIQQLGRGDRVEPADGQDPFIRYQAVLVPRLWLLTRRAQSRIFQRQSVPDILRQVLHAEWGLDPVWHLTRQYFPRNYCVQYQESDFDFLNRLMEDEGISYFFRHTEEAATLVVCDATEGFSELAHFATVAYDQVKGGLRDRPRVRQWDKVQELRGCKYAHSDYHFQLPHRDLEVAQEIVPEVKVGRAAHQLNHHQQVNGRELLEVFEYPGGFVPPFDGVSKDGGEQAQDLQDLFEDNQRLARIRMEEEAAQAIRIAGAGDCGQFLPGHHFTLDRHDEDNGKYLLTCVEHQASVAATYVAGITTDAPVYENRFECLPADLPFRPRRQTPKPRVLGPQTAVVVGPAGEEIFLDKYGRVKVRFRWDREHRSDADSSCWVRVAQFWAGKNFGAFFWPRVGHEVVVAFEHGDPDRPLVVGSVYNAANLPPLPLPDNSTRTGIKSCIFAGDPASQFNALVFHDSPGEEYLQVHSETDAMDNSELHRYQYTPMANYRFNGSIPPLGG